MECILLRMLERMTGIEPAQPAWKAGILPLNYIRTEEKFSYGDFSKLHD